MLQCSFRTLPAGYMPPEMLKGEKYDHSVDYFTLGVTLFEFLAAKNPFRNRGEKVGLPSLHVRTSPWETLRSSLSLFSSKVEREEMKERMLNRVVAYPESFSDNAKSLCDGLLAKEVDKRMGFKDGCCDEIRAHPFFSDINWRKLNAGSPHFHWLHPTDDLWVFFAVFASLFLLV